MLGIAAFINAARLVAFGLPFSSTASSVLSTDCSSVVAVYNGHSTSQTILCKPSSVAKQQMTGAATERRIRDGGFQLKLKRQDSNTLLAVMQASYPQSCNLGTVS